MAKCKHIAIGLAFLLTLSAGCTFTPPPPPLTPLEIQSLQTREFPQGKDVVFSSVVSVFQDLGYLIKSADKDTGFISADGASQDTYAVGTSPFAVLTEESAIGIFGGFTPVDPLSPTEQTSATAFIEQIGENTHVRINLVVRRRFPDGRASDEPILNAKIYQNAFERIENAIFVRTGN